MNTGRGVDCGKTYQETHPREQASNQEGSKSVFSGSGMSQERQLAQKQLDLRQSRTKKIRSNENRTKKQLTAIDGENPPRKRDLAKVDSASGSPEKMN